MVKKIKNKNKNKDKNLKIFPYDSLKSYLRKFYQRTDKRNYIAFLKLAPQDILTNGMDFIFENPNYKKYLGEPFPKSLIELENNTTIYRATKLSGEIKWSAHYLVKYAEKLNQYIELKNKFEINMAKGDFNLAEKNLELIEQRFGYSLWLIEHKLYLLQKSKGIRAQKEYFKRICEDSNEDFIINILADHISAKNEPNYKMNSFRENLIDFVDRLPLNYGDYLIFKLDFFQIKKSENFDFILYHELRSSLIDGYEAMVKILLYLASNNEKIDLVEKTTKILKCIEDKKIKKLYNSLKKENVYIKNQKSDKIIKNFDLYESGNYDKSVELSEQLLLDNILQGEIYETYLISLIKSNNLIMERDGVLFEALKICKSLISSEGPLKENYDQIQKILSINSSFSWSYVIKSISKRFYEKHHINNSDFFLSQINMEFFNLKELSHLNSSPILDDIYNFLIEEYKDSLTLNLIENFNSFNKEGILKLNIPKERKIRYLSEIYFLEKKYDQVIKHLDEYLDKFDIYSYNMVISCYIKSLINVGEIKQGLECLVNAYFNYRNSYPNLPLNDISIREIKREDDLVKEIIFPITMSLCDKYNNENLEFELYISYEQYLLNNGEEKPTNLVEKMIDSKIDKRYIIYFLEEICIISIMSKSIFFGSNFELIDERIKILEKLIEINSKSSEKYVKEIYSLKESKNLKQTRNKLDRSKIYINEEGLKERMISKLEPTFERYKNLKNDDNDTNDNQKYISIPIEGDSEETLYLVESNKKNLFTNMIGEIREVFTFDDKQGLDNCLSTEIRHGRIVNVLRKKFENYDLITKKDENDKYLLNNYWIDKYSLLQPYILKQFSTILEKFSKTIDHYMNYIKDDLIQIRTEKVNINGLFDYLIYLEELKKWEEESINMTKAEDFIEYILACFIKKTKENLLTVRLELKNQIKNEFICFLGELFSDLEKLLPKDQNHYLSDIKNKVLECKIEVQNEIDNIAKWFEFNEKIEMNDYSFNQILGLVMETIKNCSSTEIKINLNPKEILYFKGWSSRGIFTILFNLLYNAVQHSNLKKINCNIKIEKLEHDILLIIENDFDDKKNKLENTILEWNEKLCKKDILNVNKEGGSGLFKIKNILTNELSLKNQILLKIRNKKYFSVNIKIERRILS